VTQRTTHEPGTVTTRVADGVASVTFGHPKGNSLPEVLLAELAARITALGQEPQASVIVLRSEGTGAFCGGASFAELSGIGDVESGTRFFMGFANLINAMRECPRLIVTRVHGKAVGGGVGIVAASDYALAAAAAQVKLSELAVGIGPFVVGPVIERKVGRGNYAALAIDAAAWRSAEWAHQRGLFAEIHEDVEALDARVTALARQLAASNPEATAAMKRVFWEGTENWRDLLPERARLSGRLVVSSAARQAIERLTGGDPGATRKPGKP
jgi:methylglutaconyl-CoA hydratase